tara:strand:- start:299 stop:661 length:363 start_codon:yes stop_codon:yes gene_type:complete
MWLGREWLSNLGSGLCTRIAYLGNFGRCWIKPSYDVVSLEATTLLWDHTGSPRSSVDVQCELEGKCRCLWAGNSNIEALLNVVKGCSAGKIVIAFDNDATGSLNIFCSKVQSYRLGKLLL